MKYDLKKALSELKSLDWKSKFDNVNTDVFEEINRMFFGKIPLFLIPNRVYKSSILSSVKIYRVRPLNQIRNYKNYHEYSYPPNETDVKNLRANIEGVPVLYGSLHPKTAITEYVKNQKPINSENTFALSVWEIKCNRDVFTTVLINDENSNQDIKPFGSNVVKSFKNYVKKTFLDEEVDFILNLQDYMVESFCLMNNHIFSSYIAHKQLYQSKRKTDILFYPSIAENKTSINVAINKDFTDKYLKLKRVYLVKSNSFDLQNSIFLGKVLTFEDNMFKRSNILDNELKMRASLFVDFGDSII